MKLKFLRMGWLERLEIHKRNETLKISAKNKVPYKKPKNFDFFR